MRDVAIGLAILAGIWAIFWSLLFWLIGLPYTDDYACTVLIYEFETSQETAARKTSRLSANTHLVKSGIARALEWPLK